MIIETPSSFSFIRAVFSHGWFDLPPFRWDNPERTLHRVLSLPRRKSIVVSIREAGPSISVEIQDRASARDVAGIERQVRHMLRLDEPFGDFHAVCGKVGDFSWVGEAKAGPLLRSPHPFEDLVKMICTTNCTWALTRVMVGGLVRRLGRPASNPAALATRLKPILRHTPRAESAPRSFPTAEAMAEEPLRFYAEGVKAGYRARYLRDLARRVASGDLDPSRWLDPGMPTGEIREEILSVQGAGRYVADNMLKLLGRYDGLGIDSWCRRRFGEMHNRGRPVRSDRSIERFYAPFGKWRGLALWCDLTREWFKDGVPVSLGELSAKY